MNQNKRILSWKLCIPPIIVLFCVLVVYAFNGIFPFGTESIVFDDMGQCNVPIFYTMWDALHGNGSIFYNFRTAAGVFISGAYEGCMSIFNLIFFLICPRDKILESLSIFVPLKLMITSVTATMLFRYKFRISDLWTTLFGVLYAFNPFILQYYTNISWVELVMVFPLVMLGLYRLFHEKKPLLYIFSLFYCLIVQLYIAYMIILFLFLTGGMYIGLMMKKSERKGAVLRFGVSSVLAIIASAFSALPSYFYMTASSRYQNTRNIFQVLVANTSNPIVEKAGMIIMITALPTAIALSIIGLFKKDKKAFLYHSGILLMFILPVFIENTNLMWHMGSYVNFPMRYAFIYTMMLLLSAGSVIEKFSPGWNRCSKKLKITTTIVSVILGGCSLYFLVESYIPESAKIITKKNYIYIIASFVIMVLAYFLIVHFGFKRISAVLVCAMVLGESCIYLHSSFTTGSLRNYEYSLSFIEECDRIYNELPIKSNNLDRIKNIDATLNTNYPLILDYPAMSNFTHTIPASIKQSMQKLGYSSVYTRILDSGGTLFTDALLNQKYALSLNPLSPKDYSYAGSAGRYFVFENKYQLPFGKVCSKDIISDKIEADLAFKTTNNVWHAVSGIEEDLITFPQVCSTTLPNDNSVTYDFDVEGTKQFYLVCGGSQKRKNMRIFINDEPLQIPSLAEPENVRYTTRFNNSFLNVGEFTDTHIKVRVDLIADTIKREQLVTYVGLLDKALLQEYCLRAQNTSTAVATNRTMDLTATAATEQYLFLPLTYDTGWKCTVNGKTVKPEKAVINYMAIPLDEGENTIHMEFLPQGFRSGIIISIIGILLIAGWLLLNKYAFKNAENSKILNLLLGVYYSVNYGTLIVFYILPIVCKIVLIFVKK